MRMTAPTLTTQKVTPSLDRSWCTDEVLYTNKCGCMHNYYLLNLAAYKEYQDPLQTCTPCCLLLASSSKEQMWHTPGFHGVDTTSQCDTVVYGALIHQSWIAGLGRASRWKSNMLEKASALFSSRGANLQSYIYGTSALANGQRTDKVHMQHTLCTVHASQHTTSKTPQTWVTQQT